MPTLLQGKVDSGDYQRLYRATRDFNPEIRRAFRKRLRDAAKIGQRAARVKIRTMPATRKYTAAGTRRHLRRAKPVGLRSTIAFGITISVGSRDVAIHSSARGLSGRSARDLPRGIDRGGWKHPVYGHRPAVFQRGWPYFKSEIESKRPEMEREVRKILDDIRLELLKRQARAVASLRGAA